MRLPYLIRKMRYKYRDVRSLNAYYTSRSELRLVLKIVMQAVTDYVLLPVLSFVVDNS